MILNIPLSVLPAGAAVNGTGVIISGPSCSGTDRDPVRRLFRAACVLGILTLLVTGVTASAILPGKNLPYTVFSSATGFSAMVSDAGIQENPYQAGNPGSVLIIPVKKTENTLEGVGARSAYTTGTVTIARATTAEYGNTAGLLSGRGENLSVMEILDRNNTVLYAEKFSFQHLRTVPMQIPGTTGDRIPPVISIPPETTLVVPFMEGAAKIRITDEYGQQGDAVMLADPQTLNNSTGNEPAVSAASEPGSFNILILASGYSTASIGNFTSRAMLAKQAILSTPPFSSYDSAVHVNMYPGKQDLGCYSGCMGVDRLMCCDSTKVMAAAQTSGYLYDEIIVIHNNDTYAGGGYADGGTAAYKTNSYSSYCQVYDGPFTVPMLLHEFGHSFGDLCDEYTYGSEGYPYSCVNCRASCSDLQKYSGTCTSGCEAGSNYYRPERSIMLDLFSPTIFNEPSIHASYAPDGLDERLAFFAVQPVIPVISAFTATPRSGPAPLTVRFTDLSQNSPAAWQWTFGDGSTVNSSQKNPMHTYAKAGTYTVSLRAYNSAGGNTLTKTGYIQILSPGTVVVPDGGENWKQGSTQTIRWNFTGTPGSWVMIELLRGTSVNRVISSNTSIGPGGSGSRIWTVPFNQAPANDYKIRITDKSNTAYQDTSNAYFTISGSVPLAVTVPNGGQNWIQGSTHTITWKHTGDPGSMVRIELLKGNTVNRVISASTSIGAGGLGSYSWKIAADQTPGTDYKIRIRNSSNALFTDISNGTFTISKGSVPLTVTVPNGGQNWIQGSPHTITWKYSGDPGSTVKIELLQGTSVKRVIFSNTSIGSGGSGSRIWIVPFNQTPANDYKIRITSKSDATFRDTSNASFAISQGVPLTVTVPDGGQNWIQGSTHIIAWKYTGDPGSVVRIELLKGNTVNRVISASTSIGAGGLGSYSWKIAADQTPGTDYKIRIRNPDKPLFTDITNNYFTISAP